MGLNEFPFRVAEIGIATVWLAGCSLGGHDNYLPHRLSTWHDNGLFNKALIRRTIRKKKNKFDHPVF